MWRVVRAHLVGEVPIEALDLPKPAPLRGSTHDTEQLARRQAPDERDRDQRDETIAGRDTAVDEASDESFPASDPPSFTASRV